MDAKTGDLMMLPSDLALIHDPAMRKWVEVYAKDNARWVLDVMHSSYR